MRKLVISALGIDRPGIVAEVSRALFDQGCNIEEVSQTILQTEFACIFIVSARESMKPEELYELLQEELQSSGLHVVVKSLETLPSKASVSIHCEPFVVTTNGLDRPGLVKGITEIMARFGVNIINLKAVFRGDEEPQQCMMIYEVDIPVDIDQQTFINELRRVAKELELDLSIQHRNIFEAIHRI